MLRASWMWVTSRGPDCGSSQGFPTAHHRDLSDQDVISRRAGALKKEVTSPWSKNAITMATCMHNESIYRSDLTSGAALHIKQDQRCDQRVAADKESYRHASRRRCRSSSGVVVTAGGRTGLRMLDTSHFFIVTFHPTQGLILLRREDSLDPW